MPLIDTISRQTIEAFLLVVVAVALGGCAKIAIEQPANTPMFALPSAITIEQPTNNATITLPSRTRVVVSGDRPFTNLRVTVNGTDFSSQMVSGSSRAQGDFNLAAGLQTITAIAEVPHWRSFGGRTIGALSSDTKSFVVVSGPPPGCARGYDPITLDPNLATVGQRPGRQHIGYQLQNRDGLIIIVDDAPGLLRTQMLVEVDLDPSLGPMHSKMIEAWDFCQAGSLVSAVTAGMAGGFGVGVVCSPLTPANNFRSGCTTPDPPMMINQATTSELWLRKQGTFGNWDAAEAIDQSIWPIFGGRRLRFIWFYSR